VMKDVTSVVMHRFGLLITACTYRPPINEAAQK
jgi:hypothetical protein